MRRNWFPNGKTRLTEVPEGGALRERRPYFPAFLPGLVPCRIRDQRPLGDTRVFFPEKGTTIPRYGQDKVQYLGFFGPGGLLRELTPL